MFLYIGKFGGNGKWGKLDGESGENLRNVFLGQKRLNGYELNNLKKSEIHEKNMNFVGNLFRKQFTFPCGML
jgi:hypothetical protein